MKLLSWPALLGAAAVGISSISIVSLGLLKQRVDLVKKTNFVNRAIVIINEQPAVKQLIGDNMIIGRATLNDSFGVFEETKAQIKLPAVGDNDKAFFYIYARRKSPKDTFKLFKLEAGFSKVKGKKLILLDRSDEDPDSDEEWERTESEKNIEKSRKKIGKKDAQHERERINSMSEKERRLYYIQQMDEMLKAKSK